MNIVYLNGNFIPLDQAKISVMDRGFLFGDGVYEVIPVYHQRLFRVNQHLTRLRNSLHAIKLSININHEEWQTILNQLIQCNELTTEDFSIYIEITRGACEQRSFHFPIPTQPTIFARCMPQYTKSFEELAKGGSAITTPDTRWQNCYVKAITLLPSVLASQEAKEQNALDAIFIRNGHALEGASSNLFIVKNQKIITTPINHHILAGITRDLLIELMQKHHIDFEQRLINENELYEADEIWLTGSTKEILPIIALNSKPVGNGKTGPAWYKITKLYFDYKLEVQDNF